jgi:hypothetical protein
MRCWAFNDTIGSQTRARTTTKMTRMTTAGMDQAAKVVRPVIGWSASRQTCETNSPRTMSGPSYTPTSWRRWTTQALP